MLCTEHRREQGKQEEHWHSDLNPSRAVQRPSSCSWSSPSPVPSSGHWTPRHAPWRLRPRHWVPVRCPRGRSIFERLGRVLHVRLLQTQEHIHRIEVLCTTKRFGYFQGSLLDTLLVPAAA
ncbi:hypothetical protein U9M48_040588 [Paspalum notatum var. saurae]|uniref:Uncharacterized protein n=1 Tax=Paspalum notatum var. saurae TaxID=547442 RepID=A0AAQ3UM17_PASNO